MQNVKIQQIPYHGLDLVNPRITEFNNLMTFRTNQVIMLFIPVRLFVLSKIATELMLAYKVTLHQQVKRIVYRGPAYPVILIFHADVQ